MSNPRRAAADDDRFTRLLDTMLEAAKESVDFDDETDRLVVTIVSTQRMKGGHPATIGHYGYENDDNLLVHDLLLNANAILELHGMKLSILDVPTIGRDS